MQERNVCTLFAHFRGKTVQLSGRGVSPFDTFRVVATTCQKTYLMSFAQKINGGDNHEQIRQARRFNGGGRLRSVALRAG